MLRTLYVMVGLELIAAVLFGHWNPFIPTLTEYVVYGSIMGGSAAVLFIAGAFGFRLIPHLVVGFSVALMAIAGYFLYPVLPEGRDETIHYGDNHPALYELNFTMERIPNSNVIMGVIQNTGDRYIKAATVICVVPYDDGTTAHQVETIINSNGFLAKNEVMKGRIFDTYQYKKTPHIDVAKTFCGVSAVTYRDIDTSKIELKYWYSDVSYRYEFEITNNTDQTLTQALVSCNMRGSYQKLVTIRQIYHSTPNNKLNVSKGESEKFQETDPNYSPNFTSCKIYSVRFE